MRDLRGSLLVLLSLLGTGVGVYLAYVALDPNVEPFCTAVGDCHTVQHSEFSKIAGIPIAVLGLGMYLGLLALSLVYRFGPPDLRPRMLILAFALALSGTLYSGYLTYLELFEIDAICIWCVGSATVVSAIFIVAATGVGDARRALAYRPPEDDEDFEDGED